MVREIDGLEMRLHPDAYLAENATLVGEVTLEKGANIWYGAVLRGDCGAIRVGEESSVEDNVVIHGNTVVGKHVIIGHAAVLQNCTIEDECLIGMSATVMDGVIIGTGSLIAAGSLVLKGTIVPPGSLVMGAPAHVVQATSQEQREYILHGPKTYLELAKKQLPLVGTEKEK